MEAFGSRGFTRKSKSTTVPQLSQASFGGEYCVKSADGGQRAASCFPLAPHPCDVVADFIVACVVAHGRCLSVVRTIIGHAVPGSINVRFTPKADMCVAAKDGRFGPKADITQCDRYESRPRRSPIAVPRDYSMHILIYRIRLESQIAMESTHNG